MTLNVNRLNYPIKRQWIKAEWIKKRSSDIFCMIFTLALKTHIDLELGMEKDISSKW